MMPSTAYSLEGLRLLGLLWANKGANKRKGEREELIGNVVFFCFCLQGPETGEGPWWVKTHQRLVLIERDEMSFKFDLNVLMKSD